MINKIRGSVKELHPLVHCITNPISINQCANVILAAGARPIMAEHPEEAAVVTRTAAAVMLNLGNITDVRKQSMLISAQTAKELGIPFILDVCGAACLPTRRDYALSLIGKAVPSVVKGNYSEINALCHEHYSSSGVDADITLGTPELDIAAVRLARGYGTVVLASGKTDIVTDGKRLVHIYNGSPQLASITGTGCMQGALCAAYLSSAPAAEAAVAACTVFGICGSLAETEKGSGTFAVNLMDALSTATDSDISKYADTEEIDVE
ncbi:MAG: hydroxyethylthiazole kinase [Ruminiclostridium sp.]|nr:hydroxyethylthiazole kinase [Ruminiclostridium sp.]